MAESDDDMFAELEKTLCEGLTTLRFAQSVDIDDSKIDLSCLEDAKDLSKLNGPAVRSYNLWKAFKSYQKKQFLDSIYFETFAMSLFIRIKFHANKIMAGEHHMPTEDNLADLLEQKREDQPEIIDYLDRFLHDNLPPTNQLPAFEFENGTELMGLCRQLPNEWTVIQLCKAVNPEIFRQSRDELLRHPGVIFLTLFCYPMSERFDHQPIKIALNQKDLKELYESAHDLFTQMNGRKEYNKISKISDKEFDEIIVSKLKKLLGPWIVCFSGKSKSSSDDTEIINKLDLFLAQSEHRFSKRQQMLICLIVRHICMLTKENVKDAALYISKTKYEYWDLWDFFEELKLTSKKEPNSYPVILVVDEHIDFMFWEMCNVHQEFTRVDSMATLLKLFFHHQDNISEGYFNVKGKKASAVLNADRTLPTSTAMIRPFMEILPSVTCNFLVEQEPGFSDLKSMLGNSDVYVYCGHGSGLQFITSYETCQLSTNAVVFLMGCSSVAFKAPFGYCLATAAHHYYHFANSPAVIGYLTSAYGYPIAIQLNTMLGRSFSNVHQFSHDLCNNDNVLDSQTQHYFRHVMKKSLNGTTGDGTGVIKYSPYLSNVISQLRKQCIPICFRAIICHRGLPVRMGQ